jgi:hypothetical protein
MWRGEVLFTGMLTGVYEKVYLPLSNGLPTSTNGKYVPLPWIKHPLTGLGLEKFLADHTKLQG